MICNSVRQLLSQTNYLDSNYHHNPSSSAYILSHSRKIMSGVNSQKARVDVDEDVDDLDGALLPIIEPLNLHAF